MGCGVVFRLVLSDLSKGCSTFETSGNIKPGTQRRIPADPNPVSCLRI